MTSLEIEILTARLEMLEREIVQAEARRESAAFERAFGEAEKVVRLIEALPVLGNRDERMAALRAKARAAMWCVGDDDLLSSATRDERLCGQVLAGLLAFGHDGDVSDTGLAERLMAAPS